MHTLSKIECRSHARKERRRLVIEARSTHSTICKETNKVMSRVRWRTSTARQLQPLSTQLRITRSAFGRAIPYPPIDFCRPSVRPGQPGQDVHSDTISASAYLLISSILADVSCIPAESTPHHAWALAATPHVMPGSRLAHSRAPPRSRSVLCAGLARLRHLAMRAEAAP